MAIFATIKLETLLTRKTFVNKILGNKKFYINNFFGKKIGKKFTHKKNFGQKIFGPKKIVKFFFVQRTFSEKKFDTNFTFVSLEKNKCKKNFIMKVQNNRPKNSRNRAL